MKRLLFLVVGAALVFLVTGQGAGSISRERRNIKQTITINGKYNSIRHFGVANPQKEAAVSKFASSTPEIKKYFEVQKGRKVHQFPTSTAGPVNLSCFKFERQFNDNYQDYEWVDAGGVYNLRQKSTGELVEVIGVPTNGASIYDTKTHTIQPIRRFITPKFVVGTYNPVAHNIQAFMHYNGEVLGGRQN